VKGRNKIAAQGVSHVLK